MPLKSLIVLQQAIAAYTKRKSASSEFSKLEKEPFSFWHLRILARHFDRSIEWMPPTMARMFKAEYVNTICGTLDLLLLE